MTSSIILKKSSVANKIPLTTDLEYGELALNYADGKLYYKTASNTIQVLSSSEAAGGVTSVGGNTGIVTNSQLLEGIKLVDGATSGLDADLLDGQQGSYYLDWTNTTNKPTGYQFTNTTQSTSTTTGAVTVAGGVGIAGNLTVGGTITGNVIGQAYVSTTAPVSPIQNSLWWDPDVGSLFVRYTDSWVEASPETLVQTSETAWSLNGSLTVTNDVTVQGTLYETSDRTLKTNISTVKNAVDTVTRLRGVNFNWLASGEKSMGVIAQEIEAVLPHLVTESDQGIKAVNYTAIIGLLIEAVKELSDKVEKKCR